MDAPLAKDGASDGEQVQQRVSGAVRAPGEAHEVRSIRLPEASAGLACGRCLEQNFEQRVPKEVREKFDYLYDEIVRQLCDNDEKKLGPKAPKPTAPRA